MSTKDISKDLINKVHEIIKKDIPSYVEENKKYNDSLRKKAITRNPVPNVPACTEEVISETSKEPSVVNQKVNRAKEISKLVKK